MPTSASSPQPGSLRRRHCLVLLLADELQSTSLDDLRRLGVAAQHLSMDLSLPFAVLGAGLPHTTRMLRTSGVTFLERQLVTTIGALDAESTREAIEVPILDAGRKIEPAALDRLAFASGGYPFAVQVVGHHAWQAAGDDETITRVHASAAARHARRHLEQTMFEGAWARITRADSRRCCTWRPPWPTARAHSPSRRSPMPSAGRCAAFGVA